ncbi:MFS transporter [Clostridium pasteurianum]|uniref:Sugar phosphate permease n=1 Tax=Clostridium pasteurianum BC1 TaxID=86416 RepID=R4K1V2_CLOPA|nr:MFS transporter [Clostridium pasteurianum]AGK96538.1 sugar phosphate permease [Clostridium pasteurianum BC1]
MSENTSSAIKIPNKRWIHIIPPILLVYIVAFMDRTNIGFAMAGGMSKDLGMTASVTGIAAGIFFVGYLFLQVPGGQIAEHGSAKKFIAGTIVVWGILAIACGFARSTTQLLVFRFLLGVAEGGVMPAVLTIVRHWFPSEERGRATAFVIMNNPIASIITGPLSGFILTRFTWHYVFIIEGIISLALILVWLPLISDRPETAKWISKEEREYLVERLEAEQKCLDATQQKKTSLKEIIGNKTLWKLILIFFFYQTGVYGYTLWLPTILKNLTKTGMGQVGILSIFPYIATIIGLFVFPAISDKTMKRKKYVILPLIGFAICLYLSVGLQQSIWLSFAMLVGCGLFLQASSAVFMTIPPAVFSADVAGGATGIINALGNLGGFIGPFLVGLLMQMFSYNMSIYSLVLSLVFAVIITTTLPKEKNDCAHETVPIKPEGAVRS